MKHSIFPLMLPSVISIPFDLSWNDRKLTMEEDQKMAVLDRSYKRAIELAQARLREQRPNVPGKPTPGIRSMPQLSGGAHLTGVPSIYGMKEWLGELGHSGEDINRLNVIHVAGTKGKGSTCAFIESFLRIHGKRTGFPSKTGLYTSPHLIYPEERIRINFQPLSRNLFAKYFFEVEDALSKGEGRRPRYLQLYFIFALHSFIREGVDAAIIETHHGGEYDSTNIVQKPIVTCVTTLGLDHVQQLGSSLESIAWHKAGIFKPGARAIAAPAAPEAASMLEKRAVEKGAALEFAEKDLALPEGAVQIKPDVLRTNCSVAISAARAFLEETAGEKPSPLSDTDIVEGIKQWSWPGRFQIEVEGQDIWYLDGAHNEIGLNAAAEWFLSHAKSSASPKILIFAQISHVREGGPVVECLARALQGKVDHVIFTTYRRREDSPVGRSEKEFAIDELQKLYVETWKQIYPATEIMVERTIEGALKAARRLGKESGDGGMQTLITGSQHLVGPALALIRPPPAEEVV